MAIGLPPPPTPQQGSYPLLQQHESAKPGETITYGDYRLHIFGDLRIDAATIRQAVAAATTLSDAVRAVGFAFYRAGYPIAQILYAASSHDIYVQVRLRGLSAIAVPKRYQPYFDSLPGHEPLTDTALEPARTLANALAVRSRQTGTLYFRSDQHGGYALSLAPSTSSDFSFSGNAGFSNPGNRFVGRNFGNASLRVDSRWGDELEIDALANTAALGISDSDSTYRNVGATYSRVTPWGQFSVSGSYTPFRSTIAGFRVRQEIDQVTASWINAVYASFNSRVTLEIGLQRTRKNAAVDGSGATLQSQIYNSITSGLSYMTHLDRARHWRLDGSLRLTHGLSSANAIPDQASLDYLLLQPQLQLLYSPSEHWTFSASAQAQWTADRLPEQEQWVLGGSDRLTAYLPGVTVGDRGLLLRALIQRQGLKLAGIAFVPAAFLEYALSDYAHPLTGQSAGTQTLSDAGVSLRATLLTWLNVSFDIARGIGSSHVDSRTRREAEADFFFRVGSQF